MNTFFKFSMQMWLCLGLGGTLAIWQLWHSLRGPLKSIWSLLLILLLVGSSIFLIDGTFARIQDHQSWSSYTAPLASPNYTPTLDGFAFAHAWYPGDAQAITWLNQHIAGSPVILEAASPYDYTWFNRVSVYTGLPDLVGWVGHENEQRTGDQPTSRMADISVIYTTTDTALALEFLHHYNVGYIYIGDLERQAYANQAGNGLEKFNLMAQQGTLKLVYQAGGVSIYQVR